MRSVISNIKRFCVAVCATLFWAGSNNAILAAHEVMTTIQRRRLHLSRPTCLNLKALVIH